MKKILATCSALLLVCFGFTGCGSNDESSSESMNGTNSSSSSESGKDERSEVYESNSSSEKSESDGHTAGDYVSDAIDGVESAGEDIVEGVGDAAGDIVDGMDGESDDKSRDEGR